MNSGHFILRTLLGKSSKSLRMRHNSFQVPGKSSFLRNNRTWILLELVIKQFI